MTEKGKSILAYIFSWVGGLIVLYGMKDNDRNTKMHAAQAIVIGVGYIILVTIYRVLPLYIPFFNKILYGLYAVCIIVEIVKASKEADPEIPILGGIAKAIFGKKIDEFRKSRCNMVLCFWVFNYLLNNFNIFLKNLFIKFPFCITIKLLSNVTLFIFFLFSNISLISLYCSFLFSSILINSCSSFFENSSFSSFVAQ